MSYGLLDTETDNLIGVYPTVDAALADVAITPRFGPGEWRDFNMADHFLEAGRTAAQAQLPDLQALCRPVQLGAGTP